MRRVLSLVCISITSGAALGQSALQREATFVQPVALSGPGWANALDLDHDTLAVSTSTSSASGSGHIVVFGRQSGSWVEQQTLTANAIGASGGDSVPTNTLSLDGDRLAVGVPQDAVVHVYVRSGGVWSHETTIFGDDASARFGAAVALDGDRLAVGSWGDDASGTDAGAVRILERTGSIWNPIQDLRPPPGSAQRNSGWSVALDGDVLATAERAGSVRTFYRVGGTWTPGQLLAAPTSDCQDVALDGDTLVAGAIGGVGQARIWRRSGTDWIVEQTLVGTFAGFGLSVDVEGDDLVVGEPFGPIGPGIQGRAHRYHRAGATWTHLGGIGSPLPSFGDGHGACVALDGVSVAIGTPGDDASGTNRGAASVYRVLGTLGSEICSGASPAPCPCANYTTAEFDEGCRNSTGHGAFLQVFGSASVAANDLYGRVRQVRGGASVLLMQGELAVSGIAFRDGVGCVAGMIRRLRTAQAGADGVATIGPGLAGPGAWAAGQSIVLQAWHRDGLGPCGQGSNLSQGVQLVLAP